MTRGIHHVEVWVSDLDATRRAWEWLLPQLDFAPSGEWPDGFSWSCGDAYVTFVAPPALHDGPHDRRAPGVNHLAFHAGSRADVDTIMAHAPANGWSPLYHHRYPNAGGPEHYAGWLENADGFKAELVAEG